IPFSPVPGSRVKATPVAQSSPRLPNTIDCTLTAVPQSPGILLIRRYVIARSLCHESNTAPIAIQLLQVIDVQLGVVLDPARRLLAIDNFLERIRIVLVLRLQLEHDVAEH